MNPHQNEEEAAVAAMIETYGSSGKEKNDD